MKLSVVAFLGLLDIALSVVSANALDFYGATIIDEDVPTVAWKAGFKGVRPTVIDILFKSPMAECGLKRGHVIVSVNGKDVRTAAELQQISADTVSLGVLDGIERKTLKIDIRAMKMEEARHIAMKRKPVEVPQTVSPVYAQPDNSPTIVFNEITVGDLRSPTASIRSTTPKTVIKESSEGIPGGKAIERWVDEHTALARNIVSVHMEIKKLTQEIQTRNLYHRNKNQDEMTALSDKRQAKEEEYEVLKKRIEQLRKAANKTGIPMKLVDERLPMIDPDSQWDNVWNRYYKMILDSR